jgi:hypothetical protein
MASSPKEFRGGWTLLRNERLPPVLTPFWTYDTSWSWQPYQYSSYGVSADTPDTLTHDYNYYINVEQPRSVNPLVVSRGGLTTEDISALESETTYSVPDLQSETSRSRALLGAYWETLAKRGLIPKRQAF